MNQITTVGVDLAKDVIVVCAGDAGGRTVYFRQFSFHGFGQRAATLPPCTFGMEACSSAHHWARRLAEFGHAPRLMAAEFVEPFRKSQGAKNDRNDARAILSAVREPDMRFVSVKSIEQQAMLAWHRMRSGWILERTALINRSRGLLAEFGVWLGRSADTLVRALPELARDERLPERMRPLLLQAYEQIRLLEQRIEECDPEIHAHAKSNFAAQRISALSGIGPLTSSAVIATISNATDFQAALKRAPEKRSRLQQWIASVYARVGYHKTLVAIANKHARIIWAILAKGEHYDPDAWQRFQPQRAATA
jgi:transposase